MELILGAMIVALWVKTIPGVIADMVTTLRASKAGEWGLIDKQRDRKAAQSKSRREAVSKAWQATRARRNKKAGGTGQYRPGMAAYLGDVYHGVWEDQLEKRKAKRANRPAVGPDGKRPAPSRMDRAVEAKVDAQRTKTGYLGRAARLLIDPVGEKRQPADVVAPGSGTPVDPWSSADDEPTVEIAADGPRTACPVCGDTLTLVHGRWQHPPDSMCALGYPLTPMDDKPLGPEAGTLPTEGVQITGHRRRPSPPPRREEVVPDPERNNYDPCGTAPGRLDGTGQYRPVAVSDQQRMRNELYGKCAYRSNAGEGFADEWCDNPFSAPGPFCYQHTRDTEPTTSNTTDPGNTSNGGIDMSTGTVDLVDYNEAVAEHERALEQLRAQYAQACAFEQHVTGILGAVEAMDAGRSVIADALAPLSEGMEGSRYGGDATQGSAEATSALTAGSIAEVQEHIEAAADRNQRWKEELAASIEGVQASLQHIKSQYGEAAATVQETGIDARALEEH